MRLLQQKEEINKLALSHLEGQYQGSLKSEADEDEEGDRKLVKRLNLMLKFEDEQ